MRVIILGNVASRVISIIPYTIYLSLPCIYYPWIKHRHSRPLLYSSTFSSSFHLLRLKDRLKSIVELLSLMLEFICLFSIFPFFFWIFRSYNCDKSVQVFLSENFHAIFICLFHEEFLYDFSTRT